MNLEQTIMADLKQAMKAKDQPALRGIRAIKSAILIAKTDGSGEKINEEIELKILQKLVKQRKESLKIFEEQGRSDLATIEMEEIKVIQKYLPEQLPEAELESIIKEAVKQTGATGMKDMGKVMGIVMNKTAGKADGKTISKIVKSLLS